MTTTFATIPLRLIVPSTTNPRKSFDPDKMDELAASIRATGVHTPVLLRPLHCVEWSDMDPELRDRVPLLVREALLTNQWARDAAAVAMSALEPTP